MSKQITLFNDGAWRIYQDMSGMWIKDEANKRATHPTILANDKVAFDMDVPRYVMHVVLGIISERAQVAQEIAE